MTTIRVRLHQHHLRFTTRYKPPINLKNRMARFEFAKKKRYGQMR